jgi:hypothetical protein
MSKKRISKKVVAARFETHFFSISIKNEDGVHEHTRNGETFTGKQKDCPLCANGGQFEKTMGAIGA